MLGSPLFQVVLSNAAAMVAKDHHNLFCHLYLRENNFNRLSLVSARVRLKVGVSANRDYHRYYLVVVPIFLLEELLQVELLCLEPLLQHEY